MFLYSWIIENKELLRIFYTLVIMVICGVIVIKADRLFRLSLYQGIRYFRNAFVFYGIAFVIRCFLGTSFFHLNYSVIRIIFEYFIVMAGFFLLYSLLWKKAESSGTYYFSSLFNARIGIFYFMALIIVILDYLWKAYYFMFLSQIILFACASIISYVNYKKNGKQHNFLKFYFIAMLLSLIAWSLNAFVALYFNWNQIVLMNIYMLNMVVFLLFLYGVIKVTKIKI